MIITNNLGLPKAFVQMAQDDYKPTPGQYSATTIMKGIRQIILERRHGEEIKQDVADMIWLLFGTAVHSVLEQQEEGDTEFKETFETMPVGDYKLSGKFDLFDAATGTVTDYKTCSVWKIIYGDYEEWKRQLLIYAVILQYCGFNVKRGQIVALIKDHQKAKAKYDHTYPQLPVQVITFDFTTEDFAGIHEYIADRFEQIKAAEKLPDDELPVCTPEERYNGGDKYAVMKKTRKTAMKVCNTQDEAEEYRQKKGGDYIEIRKGEDKKCKDYCAACEFCNYYKEHVKESEGSNG